MSKNHPAVPAWAEKNNVVKLLYKAFRMLKSEGLSQTAFATRYVVKRFFLLQKLKKDYYLTPEKRSMQETARFPWMPKISVCVPLFNTPETFLRELIQSVCAQSYTNWQLCLADGSDGEHAGVGALCQRFAQQDGRIVYQKLESNAGIAGNRNSAVTMSDGDYIALVDHDDLLGENALYEVVKAIHETGADFLYSDEALFISKPKDSRSMHFKPDFSPDFLRGCNYICHLSVIRRELIDRAGLYDPAYEGSEDYDFTLRVTEKATAIHHIPLPLYYWRTHRGSVADDISAKPYAIDAARRAVQSHIDRIGLAGKVVPSRAVPMMRVVYNLIGVPLVSIIIPSCDQRDTLKTCIDSILQKTTYPNYEIIICENNSRQRETFAYYDTLASNERIRVVTWDQPFNFSAINNFGRAFASGAHLIFLNNDIEIITPDWIEEMVMFTQRGDVGASGVKLLYPNDTVQHGGIAVGIGGSAANLCPLFPRAHEGYLARLAIASNMSACTGACLCVRADVFDAVGGWSEELAVAFNDVDLCLKIREKGYLIVFNPVAECYHHESITRGYDKKGAKKERLEHEKKILRGKWPQYYGEGYDPYYSPNFGKNAVSYDA